MNTLIQSYRETIARLKERVITNRFLRWWLGELGQMVPAWSRPAEITADNFTLIRIDQVDDQLHQVVRDDQRERALTLPPERVLRKILNLPFAAEENLRQVLEFQMDQHTPFSSRQLYFGYWIKARDFERSQLAVEFVATPRDAVDSAIKTANAFGAPVTAVFSQAMLAEGIVVNLLSATRTKALSPISRGINPWLAALVGLLASAAIGMPLVVKREVVVQMLPWVEKGKKAAETVDTVRRELDVRVEQHNYLLEKRQTSPAAVQVIEELTRVLPDDTWVQILDIKGKELQIQGETASSVRLVGLFEQSSMFNDASFRSPLTKGQVAGTERYHLALQLRAPAKASSAPATAQPATAAASQAAGEKK